MPRKGETMKKNQGWWKVVWRCVGEGGVRGIAYSCLELWYTFRYANDGAKVATTSA